MVKRYRLRLVEVTREADDQPEAERVLLSLTDDAFSIAGWLLSGAVTITHDDPRAREQLYRLVVTQAERLAAEHGLAPFVSHEHEPGEWHTHRTSGPHAHPYGDER